MIEYGRRGEDSEKNTTTEATTSSESGAAGVGAGEDPAGVDQVQEVAVQQAAPSPS